MIHQCPICGTSGVDKFLERENIPVYQNFLFEEEQDAVNIARGVLSAVLCHFCGFIYNADFDASLLSYDEKYENTQTYSPIFEKYLDDNVDYLVNNKNIKNLHIIEIGCGKGHFLEKLVQRGGNSGIGFDPSYIGPLEKMGGKLNFKRKFYDETSADIVADVIICRHVIEHIGNPLDMLITIRKALANSPHAQVFFETPDVTWILKDQVVWDFFYEHCSYFSDPSLRLAFEKSGFLVDEVKTVFGGQYFWVEAHTIIEPSFHTPRNVDSLTELVQKFSEADIKLSALWRENLIKIRADGNIAIWGAGAKGVTFANLFDPKKDLISFIIDINPQKQNKFLPGTGHPIIGYHELLERNIKSVVILNPNYRKEIDNLLQQTGAYNINIYEFISGVQNKNIN